MQIDYRYTDASDILFPELGSCGGGGTVAAGCTILSGLKHSEDEETRELYEDCIDLLEAESIEDAKAEAASIMNNTVVKVVRSTGKMRTGYRMIKSGVALLTATSVTVVGGFAGMGLVIIGSAFVAWGLTGMAILGDEYVW